MKTATTHWNATVFRADRPTDSIPAPPRKTNHMARSLVRRAGRMLCENDFEELMTRRQQRGGSRDGGLQSGFLGTAYGQ